MDRYRSFSECWPHYLREHGRPATRALHYVGTTLVILIAAAAAGSGRWLLLLALPIAGYGLAWASHFWVGYIEWQHSELDRALDHFVSYLSITRALVARAPDSLTYRQELAEANSNIGSVKQSQGDLRGALEAFRATLAIKEDLVRRDSTNLSFLLDLGHTYNTVAVAQVRVGDDPQRTLLVVDHHHQVVRALADDPQDVAERRPR